MSLNWNWEDKMGTCTYIDGTKNNLYKGNAFTIAIHEENGYYNLAWFAADEAHMKNMLGLSKGYEENVFKNFGISEIELNTEYKETTKIVTLLAKAKMNITIKLY